MYLHVIIHSCGCECILVFVLFGINVLSSICEIKLREATIALL